MSTYSIELPINVYYSNKKQVPIRDIIKSLEGIEGLSNQFYKVATDLIGFSFSASNAKVETIGTGSLWEDIVIYLYFKDEDEFRRFVNDFGREHPVIRAALITAFFAVVMWGLYKGLEASTGVTTNIEGNNNIVININNQNLNAEDINKIIEKSVIDKRAAVNSSLKLAAPAKKDNQAYITINESGKDLNLGHKIENSLIAKLPDTYKAPIEESILHLKNAEITIRATDLDKRNQGWAGKVTGIDSRLPITIAPNVDITKLRDTTTADVAITYVKNDNNDNLRPSKIFIESLSNNPSAITWARKEITQEEALKLEDIKTKSQINIDFDYKVSELNTPRSALPNKKAP